MTVRVATFNVENLFARYRFRSNFNPEAEDGFGINNLAFSLYNTDSKRITAKAIKDADADIICLQEVENLATLERFNSQYLGGRGYKHRILIDSHDPRYIDVAVLSKYPFTYINTHRADRNPQNTSWMFSRDCLEVDVDVNGKSLSLYVNHFKSMIRTREETRKKREEQAGAVAKIIDDLWQPDNYDGNFIVLGDLNDYPEDNTSLGALLNHPHLVNVINRLPEDERWTNYWAGGRQHKQLDYLLLSKSLADANPGAPGVVRDGLPWRAFEYTGDRYDDVGEDNPKASDHCPLYMDIKLA